MISTRELPIVNPTPAVDLESRATNHRSPTTDYRPLTTDHQSPATNHKLLVFLAVILGLTCSCSRPSDQSKSTPQETPSSTERASQAHDLSTDERRGGHVLQRHVGKSDDELRERFDREPNISAASTYTDRAAAERAVGETLAANRERIDRWLQRPGGHPNLVLDYEGRDPIGRSLHRNQQRSEPCTRALVVLKYLPPDDYFVLTSYPDCR